MRHCPRPLASLAAIVTFLHSPLSAADWPQLQCDQARSGRTSDEVRPRFRVRWVWYGPSLTLRNTLANSSWTGVAISPGQVIAERATVPATVPFTFAQAVQPVVAGGTVFAGDMEGKLYAIAASDGGLQWTADIPGGTVASAACGSGRVVVGTVSGAIRAFRTSDGAAAGVIATRGPITAAPVTNGSVACVGSHDGHVYCMDLATGAQRWVSPYLGAGVAGGLAMDSTTVYVGAENMVFYGLRLSDGSVRVSKKVSGQSFYGLWPVVHAGRVYVEAAPAPAVGSEYVGEEVMAAASSADDEQSRWLDFLAGRGGYPGASPDWKHLTVLSTADFAEPFVVPAGPFDGCGTPPDPPVVDNTGRVLTYFKTRYVTFVKPTAFGTAYSLDISAISQTTGRRVPIDNGRLATEWFTWETDNCYGLSVGGSTLYLRQAFRGTVCINLATTESRLVSVAYSYQDGGNFANADIIHAGNRDTGARVPSAAHPAISGRVPPAVSGSTIFFTEEWCLVAAEHSP